MSRSGGLRAASFLLDLFRVQSRGASPLSAFPSTNVWPDIESVAFLSLKPTPFPENILKPNKTVISRLIECAHCGLRQPYKENQPYFV